MVADRIILGIVVPTRNRPALAQAAVKSILDSEVSGAEILVSDNSSTDAQTDRLSAYCTTIADRRPLYLQPPRSMSMTEHWNWALDQIRGRGITHITYLTDRMRWQEGGLASLLTLIARHPREVISYNHDYVDDYTQPVRLVQTPWTGEAWRVQSKCLLGFAARSGLHPALPRMLNSACPIEHLERLEARFGSVFASLSPDFCFAYRTLASIEEMVYYDRPCLIHYALNRSNGANYDRGGASEDALDFRRQAHSGELTFAAPIPRFRSLLNATVHEYCLVRAEAGDALPPVDRRNYLQALAQDLERLPAAARAEGLDLLVEAGWLPPPPVPRRDRWWSVLRRTLAVLGQRDIKRVSRFTRVRMGVLLGAPYLRSLWMFLARFGVSPPEFQRFRFATTEEALAYAEKFPRASTKMIGDLEPLFCDGPPHRLGTSADGPGRF